MNNTRTLSAALIGAALVGALGMALPAFAQSPMPGNGMPRPAVVGTVASVSGTSLTVTSKTWGRDEASTTAAVTYTVNAANASVLKNGATSSLSSVAVGDRVMVRGTVNGTQVTATSINDGKALGRGMGRGLQARTASSTRPMMSLPTGNGEPIIAGTVTAVSGSTLTVTTKAGIAYSVNAASSTVTKTGTASTVAAIASGDTVVVQGTVNGTSVTASSVIDQGTPPAGGEGSEGRGFFHAMGGFFARMFGFL